MSNPLQQTIEALAKEKGIEPDVVISAIEEAVATASRKYYKTGENLKTRFNMETGQVDLFALKQVVQDVTSPATEIAIDEARQMYRQLYGEEVASSIELGDEMEFPKPTEVLGRIAAQTAKQVIFQKVREAEREHIFAEYNDRVGEVVSGTIKRFENGEIIIEIGRIEAVLPRKEQSRAESYTPGERIRTVIKGVNRSAKGPQIVLSRTDPALLIKLFEQEVPEIYDGTVIIRGAVREAGDRAKVAVFSRERDVDPVLALEQRDDFLARHADEFRDPVNPDCGQLRLLSVRRAFRRRFDFTLRCGENFLGRFLADTRDLRQSLDGRASDLVARGQPGVDQLAHDLLSDAGQYVRCRLVGGLGGRRLAGRVFGR